ncbi:hypothetical protein M9H77_18209 [Catharanthus roseus]|uniref:Uncharacterized protein n=1 Tax=Catharanthus roseus TaxID=4058 RepID=A0ACC0B6T7_CATRO|nr:hypothetical protein M9H77_18209 [Catharanthus roseus]
MRSGLTHVKCQGCLEGQGKYSNFTRRKRRPRRRLRSEAVHLRAMSSRAPSCRGLALIEPCCADMLRRVEAIVSSISDAFGKFMRQADIGTGILISSLPTPADDSEASAPDIAVRSSSTPSPSIRALDTDDAPCPLVILGQIRMFYICMYIYGASIVFYIERC